LISTRDVDLQGNGEAELTWSLPAGISVLRAELDSEDALPTDNSAYLNLATTRPVRVVLVSDPTSALNRVLGALSGLNISVVQPADYALSPVAERADLTIFNGFLPEQWPVGGVLVINPPVGEHPLLNVEEATAQPENDSAVQQDTSVASLQAMRITPTEHSGELLDGLSLGSVRFGALPHVKPPDWAQIQLLADDNPLILRGQTGESEIAIWAFDLARSNVSSKLAFPLLVARTVRSLTTPALPSAVMVGQPLTVEPGPRSDHIEVENPDGETRQIPISRTLILEGLTQPGLYTFTEYAADDVVYEGSIAVNAGTPLESDLNRRPLPTEVSPFIALDASIAGDENEAVRDTPQQIWHWFALAALLVMIVEWLYVHWR
jgi:hypothetical protein